MKIAIDADGVLTDFNSGFCALADRLFPGRGIATHIPQNWDDLGGLTRAEQGAVWSEIGRTFNFWLNLPSYPESLVAYDDFVRGCCDFPHDLYVVTSRSPSAGDSLTGQTADWLLTHLMVAPQVIVVKRKGHKRRLYEVLGIEYSIDDNFETFTNCYGLAGHRAFLLDRPWNQGEAWGRRVATLAEFFERVTNADTEDLVNLGMGGAK